MWYVVETLHTARVYFSGIMLFVKDKSKLCVDDSVKLLQRYVN